MTMGSVCHPVATSGPPDNFGAKHLPWVPHVARLLNSQEAAELARIAFACMDRFRGTINGRAPAWATALSEAAPRKREERGQRQQTRER